MPVFISHSHNDEAIYTTLCLALDLAKIPRWDLSSLAAGVSLADQLRMAIEQCEVCIFLATKSSVNSTWCLAELGAFWGAGKKVIIYMSDPQLTESELPPQFRGNLWATNANQLIEKLKSAYEEAFDIFLAVPMAAYENEDEYQAARNEVLKIISTFRELYQLRVYCAIENRPTIKSFQTASVSVKTDFKALRQSRTFVLIYPKKLHSSVILEAGFALALRKYSVYFVSNRKDLPFMLQEAAGAFPDVVIEELTCSLDYNCIIDAIKNNGKELFGLV